VVGTQTGKPEDYEMIAQLVSSDTVILDDANPAELENVHEADSADILVGGVKERLWPISWHRLLRPQP
jgi:nitrogenase molybdenum-cofactor synthesis protein NifE